MNQKKKTVFLILEGYSQNARIWFKILGKLAFYFTGLSVLVILIVFYTKKEERKKKEFCLINYLSDFAIALFEN